MDFKRKIPPRKAQRSEVMKISSILRDLLTAGHADVPDAAWADDPYAHPEIDAMSERERADLPPTHMPVAYVSAAGRLDRCIAAP